jgi:hypothetical protein
MRTSDSVVVQFAVCGDALKRQIACNAQSLGTPG